MKELCLTIPCEPAAGPDKVRPVHIHLMVNGYADSRWQCPHCYQQYHRAKPCRWHMGMTMNIPAGCPVLKAQDESRRLKK